MLDVRQESATVNKNLLLFSTLLIGASSLYNANAGALLLLRFKRLQDGQSLVLLKTLSFCPNKLATKTSAWRSLCSKRDLGLGTTFNAIQQTFGLLAGREPSCEWSSSLTPCSSLDVSSFHGPVLHQRRAISRQT